MVPPDHKIEGLVKLFAECDLTVDAEIEAQDPWAAMNYCSCVFGKENSKLLRITFASDALLIRLACADHRQIARLEDAFEKPGAPRKMRWTVTVGPRNH